MFTDVDKMAITKLRQAQIDDEEFKQLLNDEEKQGASYVKNGLLYLGSRRRIVVSGIETYANYQTLFCGSKD